jgi:Rrf2 family protein
VRLSTRSDQAIRVLIELAVRSHGQPVATEVLAHSLDVSEYALPPVLSSLRRAGILAVHKGWGGGYRFGRPPEEITVAEVIGIFDGPLLTIGDNRRLAGGPDFSGPLEQLWMATRISVGAVLESVTVADLAAGVLPSSVTALTAVPGSP